PPDRPAEPVIYHHPAKKAGLALYAEGTWQIPALTQAAQQAGISVPSLLILFSLAISAGFGINADNITGFDKCRNPYSYPCLHSGIFHDRTGGIALNHVFG